MNSKSLLFTNLIILLAGILLCYVHARENIISQIIFIAGITLAVPGIINLFLLFSHDKDSKHKPTPTMKIVGWISGVASVGLGALMILLPGLFTPILVYIFGVVMILASLLLLFLMTRTLKANAIAGWVCVGPGLVLVAGVIMICLGQPAISDAMVALITGISMIVFAISWFTASIMLASHNRHVEKTKRIEASNPETSLRDSGSLLENVAKAHGVEEKKEDNTENQKTT